MRITKIFVGVLCLSLLFSGCSKSGDTLESIDTSGSSEISGNSSTASSTDLIATPPPAPNASANRPTRPVTATAVLADGNIKTEGDGLNTDGNTLTISADGVYEVSGTLTDGQIIIDAPKTATVELVLSGVDISGGKNAAIYCKSCDDFVITLAENTENVLIDAENFAYDNIDKQEPNAVLFSKTDMNIGGSGRLTINANFKHGISSKDDLVIEGGEFVINSEADAIRGKDSLVILNGRFKLNAGGDGLQASSTEGAEFGYLQISDGEYTIRACGDAIQAETALTISGGAFDITTEGAPLGESDSQKGIKAGTFLTIEDGTFNMICHDDGIHSNMNADINGGSFYIETDDDGIHADNVLRINGGNINIPVCYEGFEGTVIEVNGGKSFIESRDDSLSATAGTPEAKAWTGGREGNPYVYAVINGGELEAVSGGDTVDSNGNIYVKGGTLRLSSPPRPNYEGSLFCNGDVTISGGNVAAVGNLGVGLYGVEQPILWISHVEEHTKGSVISLRDRSGNTLLELTTRANFIQSSFTSDELKTGETYIFYIDDEKIIDVTLTELITKIGDDGGAFTGGYDRRR